MQNYSEPSIKFDELVFFEKIASDCWFSKEFYIDKNHDNDMDDNEDFTPVIIQNTCKHTCSVGEESLYRAILCQVFGGNQRSFDWYYNKNYKHSGGYNGNDWCVRNNTAVNGVRRSFS